MIVKRYLLKTVTGLEEYELDQPLKAEGAKGWYEIVSMTAVDEYLLVAWRWRQA